MYMLEAFPDRFAAAVPVVGAYGVPEYLLDESIWAFQPRDDFPSIMRYLVSSILAAAGEPPPEFPPLDDTTIDFEFHSQLIDLHYTEPATGGHIYVAAYAQEPMYDWLFARGVVVPEPSSIAMFLGVFTVLSMSRTRRRSESRM
jgi:predicted peptidase